MEVHQLAPALLALGDLFREANDVLHPDGSTVSLQIKATHQGSFDISLILSVVGAAASVLTSNEVTALANLKELVIGDDGLFALIRRLRGRRITSTETDVDGFVYESEDGDRLKVPRFTHAAFQRVQIRRRTREFLQPLEAPGVEKAIIRETDVDHCIEITVPPPLEVVEADVQPLTTQDREIALEITSPAFREGNKWRVSDGTATFPAAMEDAAFLERVANREEAFLTGNILICDVRVEQYARPTGGLRTEYAITRVRSHISPPAGLPPPQLFEGEEGE